MRLIDADAIPYTMLYKESWLKGTGVEEQGVFKSAIDAMLTIEAEPIKHGRWIKRHLCNGDTVYQCDQKKCYKVQIHMSPYCPNCGAKMDKEDEGNDEN